MNTVAEEMGEWLNSHFVSGNLRQLRTNIHEASHIVYDRDVGHDPEVFGPHWETIDGRRRRFLGGVGALPEHIQLNHDPVLVGKCFLGPRYVQILLRGKHATDEIWFEARRDLELFNEWCRVRQALRNDLPENLKTQIERAVRRDFNDPVFQRRLWETALEYERRISEQAATAEANKA